ncbi:hypothetical protein S7335_2680 [Synechococcus sp. PCC 7335]|uniref:hypothetical protein n=1 Tax=Synechococcus sp. (strain ATCC 29403 / PCC 7335) TaxID=91464 RepID=UPI00017EE805|nr:hypothetical protein [Synechococcus sp. PCC 7335]EDX84981.1 hypothetical protein S7335_2680 [Synechococcus sp. PCC 7335]
MYDFSPLIQAGIAAGKYIPVETAAGVPIGMVRDAATGQFAAHAIGMGLTPLTATPQAQVVMQAGKLAMGAGQLYQGHKALQGIKALSASVATLQATTAVIGVGVVGVAALSAVNLWQTLKLRKDVQQMRVEVREGFIDLKQVFADQGKEIIEHIQHVSEDVEFRAHRTILVRAYGLFEKAMNRLGSAVTMQDLRARNDEIKSARDMMFQALSDYDNSQLMKGVGSVAYIRRRECVWAIEQAIAMTYQMQGEWQTVGDRLINLNATIRQDAIATLDKVKTSDELDFLFPELTRIRDHDLVAINAWNDHIEWSKELSIEEMKQLNALVDDEAEKNENDIPTEDLSDDKPIEYSVYEEAKSNFVSKALHQSLVYSFSTERRRQGEEYIAERAALESLTAFNPQNLSKASPLAVANLELYFATKDESLADEEEDAAIAA